MLKQDQIFVLLSYLIRLDFKIGKIRYFIGQRTSCLKQVKYLKFKRLYWDSIPQPFLKRTLDHLARTV